MRIGILNVTGYAGLELIRLLAWHPEMQIVAATGRSQAGKRLAEVFPFTDLFPDGDLGTMTITEEITTGVDLVFLRSAAQGIGGGPASVHSRRHTRCRHCRGLPTP